MCVYYSINDFGLWFTNEFINILLEFHHSRGSGIISLILETRELSLKGFNGLAQGHAKNWQS